LTRVFDALWGGSPDVAAQGASGTDNEPSSFEARAFRTS